MLIYLLIIHDLCRKLVDIFLVDCEKSCFIHCLTNLDKNTNLFMIKLLN